MPRAQQGQRGWCQGNVDGVGLVPWVCQSSGAGAVGAAGRHACQQLVPMPAQAERRLQVLEGKESRAQRRLRELAQRVTALQERGRDARRMAQQAKDGAQRATTASGTLSQVSPGPARLRHSTKGVWGARGGSASLCLCAARTWRR